MKNGRLPRRPTLYGACLLSCWCVMAQAVGAVDSSPAQALPSPSLLTKRPNEPLQITVPSLARVKQNALPSVASIAGSGKSRKERSVDYFRLGYTPVPAPMTSIKRRNHVLTTVLAPLVDAGVALAYAVPLGRPPVAFYLPPERQFAAADVPAVSLPVAAAPSRIESPDLVVRREKIHLPAPPGAEVSEQEKASVFASLVPAAGAAEAAPKPLIPMPDAREVVDKVIPSAPMPAADPNSSPTPSEVGSAAKRDTAAASSFSAPPIDQMVKGPLDMKGMTPIAEPLPDMLSDESRRILDRMPSGVDTPKKKPSKLDVARAKDTKYVSKDQLAPEPDKADKTGTAGVKIAVKKPGEDWNYELEKAYGAVTSGQTDAAVQIYKNILDNDPRNKLALFGLATIYHRAGQLHLARPLYGKLLEIDPDNRDALNNFLVLIADESPQEALLQLGRLQQKNPHFSPIMAQMAVIYQKLGDAELALSMMQQAVALSPENITYQYNLAILLDKQKKYEEAAKIYRRLLEANLRGETIPGNPQKIQERLTFISSNRR